MKRFGVAVLALALAGAGAAACGKGPSGAASGSGGGGGGEPSLTIEELKDPASCKKCHSAHYTEWSGSMHAYAADDPIFLAMNARGQRETKGALGDFCVKCHAPIAVRDGATKDGLNLAQLPASQKGVTCYFCHSVSDVTGTHDNPLTLASDGVLRAGISDPLSNGAHRSTYSTLHDRAAPDSAKLCGACHDIVTPGGDALERTYSEWQHTLFADAAHPANNLTCSQCHMEGTDGLAANDVAGVKERRVHSHTFPGVDLALGAFPEAAAQKPLVQAALDTTLGAELCVKGVDGGSPVRIQIVLDNLGAGHAWPSGATQDRRAWVEVVAYAQGKVIYQSGAIADGDSVMDSKDPDLWLIRDCMFDAKGNEVHMFWEAQTGENNLLPGPTTSDTTNPAYYLTHVMRTFPRMESKSSTLSALPDRVTMRVRLVPVGLDVLDDLIKSGDLAADVKKQMTAFTLASVSLEWTAAKAGAPYPDQGGTTTSCVTAGVTSPANLANPAPERTMCSP